MPKMTLIVWCCFFLTIIGSVFCESNNAGTSVSPWLMQCYNGSNVLNTNNLPPATINILISLIQKLEDTNPNIDARELSSQLLHMFKQDGIIQSERTQNSMVGIPFSPRQWHAYKNMVLLKDIVPKTGPQLDVSNLTQYEFCGLHRMLSHSTETAIRGDESEVCHRVARLTLRGKRDVEPFENVGSSMPGSRSECPVETGAVYTPWGAIAGGNVLAGIAAGLNEQAIPVKNLSLNALYGATLAGDLSEIVLYQTVAEGSNQSVIIGIGGTWNSTLMPKYYFAEKNRFLQMTDIEIRGDIDGLLMALNVKTMKQAVPLIKVSQILDMYYSQTGLLNREFRACNRLKQAEKIVDTGVLIKETTAFTNLLDDYARVDTSIAPIFFKNLSTAAVQKFVQIKRNLVQTTCVNESDFNPAVDIKILVDFTQSYDEIKTYLSYILQNLEITKYGGNYSIINAQNGDMVVNQTSSLLNLHTQYNKTVHDRLTKGCDFSKVLEVIHTLSQNKIDSGYAGGDSNVYLIYTGAQVQPSQTNIEYAQSKINEFKTMIPDTRTLVLTRGNAAPYNAFVIASNTDIFTLSSTSENEVRGVLNKLVKRIKELPRAIVNPTRNSQMTTTKLRQTVEVSRQNLYKTMPANFGVISENSQFKVDLVKSGNKIKICYSHDVTTFAEENCLTKSNFALKLSPWCSDSGSECDPIYLRVEGLDVSEKCTDETGCRTPNSVAFDITLENVGYQVSDNGNMFPVNTKMIAIVSIILFFLPF